MSVDRELLSSVLPAYDIGDELGKGGWGVVVSGQHRQLDRQVAIKQLPAALAADPAVRRRFTAEARVLASLDHPHVVPVYDFVERDGVCLLVMELLPGGTLRSRVHAAGRLTAPYAVAVSLACTSGLGAAHRRGVLHRDVKPENMLFAGSGILKVTDFGIAKVVGGPDTVVTRAGEVLGTPAYIAPEQVRGGELSPATDVYGVATMLYELLADALPFASDGEDVALLFKHAYEAPIPLREVAPAVPDPVAAVVMRGLATEPAERFATAESFGVALAEAATQAWGPGLAVGRAGPHPGRRAHHRRRRASVRAAPPGRAHHRARRAGDRLQGARKPSVHLLRQGKRRNGREHRDSGRRIGAAAPVPPPHTHHCGCRRGCHLDRHPCRLRGPEDVHRLQDPPGWSRHAARAQHRAKCAMTRTARLRVWPVGRVAW